MFSDYIEGKSVVDERFISTLKNKNLQILTSVSTNMYTDKLDDIVNNTIIHVIAQLRWILFMQSLAHILTLI